MTDDPKRFYALGYCFLRGEDDVYRCEELGLEIFGLYGVGDFNSPFTVRSVSSGGKITWATKRHYGKHEGVERFRTRTGAAKGGMRRLCGITKARKG